MQSFTKRVLPYYFSFVPSLFLALMFLFNGEALAATSLDKVKLESSSINQQSYSDITSPECTGSSATVVRHRVIDEYATSTINSYNSQYLSRDCRRKTELYNISVYWGDCSFRGTDSTSRDDGENCNEVTIDRTTLTLALIGGSVRETISVHPNWYLTACALCSLPFEYGGFIASSGESSLTLTIDCQEEKTVKILYIKAEGFIISETQPTGMEFLINGFSPSSVYPEDVYQDFYKVYAWSGILKWKIPIDKKCGENITITPSVAGGYGQVGIKSIKATDCEVNVDVFLLM